MTGEVVKHEAVFEPQYDANRNYRHRRQEEFNPDFSCFPSWGLGAPPVPEGKGVEAIYLKEEDET